MPWLVALLTAALSLVHEATLAARQGTCTGAFSNRVVEQVELDAVLKAHSEWLSVEPRERKADDPRRANLCNADLNRLSFDGANLYGANLRGANFTGITTRLTSDGAWAGSPANFSGADLAGAEFTAAELKHASFGDANLSGAQFRHAILLFANLSNADITEVNFSFADLHGVVYEPKLGTLPIISRMTEATDLCQLQFDSPHSVSELRDAFRKWNLRDQERQLTCAIKRYEVAKATYFEQIFNYVLFDATSHYGMSPGRPLIILFFSVLIFSIPYCVALNLGRSGIWIIWPKDRLPGRPGSELPERLIRRFPACLPLALYFSILSAASIGWRDLNVGSWIARVQTDEYSLRPSGWVRSVSGVQSLISVYLMALSVLTYFGRPFE